MDALHKNPGNFLHVICSRLIGANVSRNKVSEKNKTQMFNVRLNFYVIFRLLKLIKKREATRYFAIRTFPAFRCIHKWLLKVRFSFFFSV
jgi:hypothetical protein